jgi:hypothetical protein
MFWIILITAIVLLFTWILVAPVILFLDTVKNRYAVSLPGVFTARVIPDERLFHIRGWIFFIPYRFNPFRWREKKPEKEDGIKPSRKKKRRGIKGGWKGGLEMARGFITSFRIRKLHLDLDTEDVILNAWLIPVFTQLNSDRIRLRSNFEGRTSLLMDLRTRLGSLLWVLIRNRFRRK